jgi:hypothetical protein
MCAKFDELTVQLKGLEQKSDAAWEQLHKLANEAHNAFDDDAEFNRLHDEMDVKSAEIDVLAKSEEAILAEMDALLTQQGV